jgi:hypothetical protein
MSLILTLVLILDATAAAFTTAVALDCRAAKFTADEKNRIDFNRAMKKLRS